MLSGRGVVSHWRPRAGRLCSRGIVRAPLVCIAAMVMAMAAAPSAQAHTELLSSSPERGVRLPTAPAQVRLTFSDDIDSDFAVVALEVNGTTQRLETSVVGGVVTAPVPASSPGDAASGRTSSWTISYRVVSTDGHPVNGTVGFKVDRPRSTQSRPPSSEAQTSSSPQPGQTTSTESAASTSAAEGGSRLDWLWVGGIAAVLLAAVTIIRSRRNRLGR